jgi:hypothetical protein
VRREITEIVLAGAGRIRDRADRTELKTASSRQGGASVPKLRIVAIVGVISVVATAILMSLTPVGAAPARMIRGVIGSDVEGVAGLTDGGDWGAVASIGGNGAATRLNDTDVAVAAAIPGSADDGDVVVGDAADHECSGTWQKPTAPPDQVCIYIANADNAVDIHGVSISPGSRGTKYGFKIVWSHALDGEDSFVDAVWAYNRPAT